MRISDIRDPALFQRLVRKLMICEYGRDHQVVDDAGGDSGLDGFNGTTGELHAIYCPAKPESADYRRKLRSDLQKAARLRDHAGYQATSFVFITPQPMREPLQRELRDLARGLRFDDGVNIAAEHLEVLLAKHGVILDQFPELSYPRVQATLGAIADSLERIESAVKAKDNASDGSTGSGQNEKAFTAGFFDELDFRVLNQLQSRLETGDKSALYDLEQYRLEITDPLEDLAAASIQIDFEFRRLNFDRVLQIASTAARHAHHIARPAEESVFRAHSAKALVLQASGRDIDLAAQIAVSVRVGVNIIDPSSAEQEHGTITRLYDRADAEMRSAFSLASGSSNLDAMYFVLMTSASCEVHKALPHGLSLQLGQPNARLPYARAVVMSMHEAAIRIARLLGNERLSMAYHNFANDLRSLGELQRAQAHAHHAREIASQCGYGHQVRLSERLLEFLAADLSAQHNRDT